MPRPPRLFEPGVPLHILQRGNNRGACFQGAEDYASYLHWLNEYTLHHGCALHAYVLMTNHVHLFLTPSDPTGPSAMMQSIGRKYVSRYNRKYSRTGTLWEGRFKSNRVESDRYVLTLYRYIDLNPVRARMVENPAKYRWSSYHHNAFGRADARIRPHELFTALGTDKDMRCKAYRGLIQEVLDIEVIESIRACLASGKALRTPD
jgi:putative transposase